MVSNEIWMGSGTSVTFAPESELFLGYMPYGPTLGREGTNRAHLIKYSLGYAVNGSDVVIENAHGEGTNAVKHFTDYYHLVPDLYTGCTAKFYAEKDASGTTYDLLYTATVAGNDADAIYFAGNLSDFVPLHAPISAQISDAYPRGYIVLEARGSIIPAPVTLETRTSDIGAWSSAAEQLQLSSAGVGSTTNLKIGDIIYNQAGLEAGKIWTMAVNATLISTGMTDGPTHPTIDSFEHIHTMSATLGTADSPSKASNVLWTVLVDGLSDSRTSLAGIFTAGDWVSFYASDDATSATILGIVVTMNAAGTTLIVRDAGTTGPALTDDDPIYWGRDLTAAGTSLLTAYPSTLSDNWLGLINTVTPPTVEIEMKQVNLALAGTRNWSYQYKGMETAGEASLDLNLNHGSWLYYALGNFSSVSSPATNTINFNDTGGNAFRVPTAHGAYDNAVTFANTNASVWAGYDNADSDAAGAAQNGKFHRVPNGTTTLCPPIIPGNGASPLSGAPTVSNGVASNLITYTFTERNDAVLPTFALELTQEKGSNLGSIPMVDRNAYNQTCYAQLFPGCMVNTMTFTANANEEVKATLSLNVKRVFEAPNGYVAKGYDATNNDTTEFKNLFNFGQITSLNTDVTEAKESLINPFYFSDGTISLFGNDFMRVEAMSLTITNSVTDKRYIGQYNKQIKMAVPAQRLYELTMTAQVTDRRIFDELRRQSPHRFALYPDDAADGTHAKIQLLFTKDNGERIKMQFDDYMISATNWPIPDDKGVIMVDMTIMPLRIGTMDAVSGWILQT